MNDTIKREKTIAEARAELGMSRKFLAELLEVSRWTILGWEHGIGIPKPIHRQEVQRLLKMREEWLPSKLARLFSGARAPLLTSGGIPSESSKTDTRKIEDEETNE